MVDLNSSEGGGGVSSSNKSSSSTKKSSKSSPSTSSSSSSSSSRRKLVDDAINNNNNNSSSDAMHLLNGTTERSDTTTTTDAQEATKIKKKKKKRRSSTSAVSNNGTDSETEGLTTSTTTVTTTKDGKKLKKKKSKRRSSSASSDNNNNINNATDGELESGRSTPLNNTEGGSEQQQQEETSTTTMLANKLRDSLTIQSKSRSVTNTTSANNNAAANNYLGDDDNNNFFESGGKRASVQFTSSVIERDMDKLIRQIDTTESDDEDGGEEGGVGGSSVKSNESSGGGGGAGSSALKKTSKYGSGGGGGRVKSKRTSFAPMGGKEEDNDDDNSDNDDSPPPPPPPTRGKFELRPSYKIGDDDDDDDENDRGNSGVGGGRRKSRKEMFARAAGKNNDDDDDDDNDDDDADDDDDGRGGGGSGGRSKVGFRENRRASAPTTTTSFRQPFPQSRDGDGGGDNTKSPPRRASSVRTTRRRSSNDSSDEFRGSFTLNNRPVMSRKRSSFALIDTNNDSNHDSDDVFGGGGGGGNLSASSKIAQKVNAVKGSVQLLSTSQKKEGRRVKMALDNQIFVPPRNRTRNVLSAMSLLMAGRVVDLVLWTYKASFGKVMLFFLTFYVVNIFMWAGVMDAVDIATGGRCIHDESFDASAYTHLERYEFAFELSWTTFTTVGYGAISPTADVPGCYAIRLVCAFVAFTGVLFGSTTAAIMYSKLMRLLAKAHVTFSSTLCIQYGKGNESSTVRFGQFNFRASVAPAVAMQAVSIDQLMMDSPDKNKSGDSEDGFPVIEFRMVNDRANHEGSEIWDAQIRGIIQLNKEVNPNNNLPPTSDVKATGGESTLDLDKKAYYQFALTPDSHPHFSRIWYARHVLNAESPLLKREIRNMIVQDGGKWDKDFNTASEIRKCLNEFISLRITLSGTSAVSANTVFAEHVYEYEDVVVGWRFANMVYEKPPKRSGRLLQRLFGRGKETAKGNANQHTVRTKVDKALIHDIVPQPGDDYEDLDEMPAVSFHNFGFMKKRPE